VSPDNPLLMKNNSNVYIDMPICLPASPTASERLTPSLSITSDDLQPYVSKSLSPLPPDPTVVPPPVLTSDPTQASAPALAPTPAPASAKSGRGNYKCGRCGVPKKGHICPYKPRLKRTVPLDAVAIAIQCDMGDKKLGDKEWLKLQGTPGSYVKGETSECNSADGEEKESVTDSVADIVTDIVTEVETDSAKKPKIEELPTTQPLPITSKEEGGEKKGADSDKEPKIEPPPPAK